MPGSVGDTGFPGLGKIRVPVSVERTGCEINKLNKTNVSVTALQHFNANSTAIFELKSNK